MADSIQFDSTELVNATYVLRTAQADGFARTMNAIPRLQDDGEILINTHTQPKVILVRGTLNGSSASDLQSKLDTLKKTFAGKQKNLDITPNGGSLRRYVATCRRASFNRDFFHIAHIPYEAEFVAHEGVGKATSTTSVLTNDTQTADYSDTLSFSLGSADPKPIFTLVIDTAAGIAGIRIRNETSGESINESLIVTQSGGFTNGDTLEVDCEAETVKLNGAEINYYGKFPRFGIGNNNVDIDYGILLAEDNTPSGTITPADIYGNTWQAQSFMVNHTDETYRRIRIPLIKVGSPPNDLTITIEGDNNGEPDGSAVATFTITAAEVNTSITYVEKDNASDFTLDANTRYWIVCKTTAGDNSNKYRVYSYSTDVYARGNYSSTADGGSTWIDSYTQDMNFQIYFGSVPGSFSVTTTIEYYARYL